MFLHTYLPDPVIFHWQFISLHWYGMLIALAISAALAVSLKLARQRGLKSDEVFDLAFYLIIFGIIGARIYAIFLDLGYYLKNPFEIVAVWHGGLAIHGAIAGGLLALIIYGRRRERSFWLWADLAAPGLALAQAIGRWGNYFSQEVFGRPTDLPWGIPISYINRPVQFLSQEYFHPTFLYESLLDLANFLLLYFLFRRFYGRDYELRIKNQELGIIFFVYLINYSLIRLGMEFLRVDETIEIWGIRWPIVVSLIIIIAGIIGLSWRLRGKQ
jgi:phosphatidylglycerol:prolipoprotein diacylglycerol transferase